jgi:7-cyano-7-deazaguanine synthase in queuosine biosynthesis
MALTRRNAVLLSIAGAVAPSRRRAVVVAPLF